MSSLDGRLQEVVVIYESLDQIKQTFAWLPYCNFRDLPHVLNSLFMRKVNFEKYGTYHW